MTLIVSCVPVNEIPKSTKLKGVWLIQSGSYGLIVKPKFDLMGGLNTAGAIKNPELIMLSNLSAAAAMLRAFFRTQSAAIVNNISYGNFEFERDIGLCYNNWKLSTLCTYYREA